MPFGWYEEGFDKEIYRCPAISVRCPLDANGTHASYITHHNGPQYFGYISNNPNMSKQLHGLGDFFSALENKTLPRQGGVFFVKGGYTNLFGLKPVDPDPTVQRTFSVMTTIPLIPTLKSAKRWWPKPSTRSPRAPTGPRVPSSSLGTTPRATMTTFNRRFALMVRMVL